MKTQFRLSEVVAACFSHRSLYALCLLAVLLWLDGMGLAHAASLVSAKGTIAVDVYDNVAATADRAGMVRLFDVTAPAHPVLISQFMVPRELTGIALAGKSLLVSGQGGVTILDISNPRSIQVRSVVELPEETVGVKAAGDLGYTAYGSTVVLFEIATGKVLSERSYSGLMVNDLALWADNLYVLSADAEGTAGIALEKLAIQGSLGMPVASWTSGSVQQAGLGRLSLYAADNLVVVGSVVSRGGGGEPGMETIQDMGSSFKTVGLPAGSNLGAVRPSGEGLLAFAGASSQGESMNQLGVLNMTDPSRTNNVLQTMETSGPAYDVALHGEYAYVAAGAAGLQVIAYASPAGLKKLPALMLNTTVVAETPLTGSMMRLTADVAAADQVSKVDFYLNGALVASDGNYPFEYRFAEADLSSVETLTAYACAEDIDGNRSCSSPKTLNTAGSGLKVVSVTPAANARTAHSSKLSVSAQFSQALDVTTVALQNVKVVKQASGKTPASVIALSGVTYQASSKSLVIQPKSPLATGTYQVTLAPSIRSSGGATLASSYVWTFNVTAATDNWTNAESGDWAVGTNWSLGVAPAAGDTAVIDVAGVTVTMSASSGNVDLAGLTVGTTNTLTIAGGSLSIQSGGSATINGTLNLASGTLGGPGATTVAGKMGWTGGTVSGVLTIAAKAVLALNTTANVGFALNGGGILNNSGTVNQSFAGTPGNYTGFQIGGGAAINNLTGAVWNVTSDVWMQTVDASAVAFNNAGTFNKTGGTNSSIWSVPFTGAGAINIGIGELNLKGNLSANAVGKLSAPIAISAKATLDYGQGGILNGAKVTGAGTMNFNTSTTVSGAYAFAGITQIQSGNNAVTFQNPTSIAMLNLLSGNLAGTGPVTVTGTTNWTGGGVSSVLDIPAGAVLNVKTTANVSFFLNGGGILNNSGTVNQSFAGTPGTYTGFQIGGGAAINNQPGGVWNVTTNVWMQTVDATGVAFNNAGTFNKTGGTNSSIWSVPFTGGGAINIGVGELNLNGNLGANAVGKLAAPIAISTSAILDYGQGGILDGSKVTGTGTMNFNSGTTVSGAYTFAGITQIQSGGNAVTFQNPTTIATLNLLSGTLAGAGPVTVPGTTDWTGGGVSGVLVIPAKAVLNIKTTANTSFFMNGGGILNNSGTVNQSFAGTPGNYTGFQIGGGAVINNLTGGIWNVLTDVWMQTVDSTAVSFNNAGTFGKTGGTNSTIWSVPFTGAGAINLNVGELNLNGNLGANVVGRLAAPIAINTSAVLDYGQGGILDGTKVTGTGKMNFNTATTVSGAYTFAGITQIQSGSSAITFQNPTTIATLNLISGTLAGAGPVTVIGTTNWTGGGVSGVLDIPVAAVLNIKTTANTSFFMNGGGVLNNSGTVNQTFAGTPGNYTGFQIGGGAIINNYAKAVWNVNSDVWMQTVDATAVAFNNAGTFNKVGGSNTSIWSVPFTGAGAINLEEGDFNLNGNLAANAIGKLAAPIAISAKTILDYGQGGVLDGTTVTGAGTMNFNAATTVSGAYTFAGVTQIQSGSNAVTFQNPTTIATLNLISGTLAGPGPVMVTGTTNWTGGGVTGVLTIPVKAVLNIFTTSNTTFFLKGGGVLNNYGTVNQSFSGTAGNYTGFQVSGGGVINNFTGGVWNVLTDVWMQTIDASAVAFNNAGTFNKTGGTNNSIWSLPFTGAGAINIDEGEFNLNGNLAANVTGKLAAPIAISAKATVDYGQGAILDGTKVTGAGTMNFNAATTISGAYTFAGLTQIQSGSNAVTFQNPTTIAALNLTSGTLAGVGPVSVTGTMNWTGGGLTGVLDIPASAVLNIKTTSNTTFFLNGGGILNNSGTVNQSFAGTPGNYTGFQISGGGAINNLTGGVWNLLSDVWMQSTDSSAVAFKNAGTFNKNEGANNSIWGIAYNNTGTVNVNSGTLSLSGTYTSAVLSGTLNLGAAGTLNYSQQGTLANGTASGAGTFNMNNNSGTTTVSGTYKMTTPAQVLGGVLNVLSGATLDAGTLTLSSATFTVGGTTSAVDLSVTGPSGQSGSNVDGSGTINVSDTTTWGSGNLDFTGGFNTNNLTMAQNSGLDFKVGSGAISVSGSANLDGDISITLSGNNPAVGKVFKILNFANNFLGDLLDLVNIPIPGTNDYLAFSLDPTGLTITVDENSSSNVASANAMPRINSLRKGAGRVALAH